MNNFRDPIKTVAYKRQASMLHLQLNKNNIRDFVKFGAIYEYQVENFSNTAELFNFFRPTGETIQVSNEVIINGVTYSTGMFMAMEHKTEDNSFFCFWKN